jgi:hypothetical protein
VVPPGHVRAACAGDGVRCVAPRRCGRRRVPRAQGRRAQAP